MNAKLFLESMVNGIMCILKHDKDMAITQWPKMPSLMDV